MMYQIGFNDVYYKTVKARVRRGIKFLNANVPGWRNRISLKKLDLASGEHCILGQTFKKEMLNGDSGYGFGVDKYFNDDDEKAAHYGFYVSDREDDQYQNLPFEFRKNAVDPWTILGEVWEDELRKIPRK